MRSVTPRVLPALLLPLLAGCASPDPGASAPARPQGVEIEEQASGVSALLQAVSVVDEDVAWVSGHRGTVLRTTDGGRGWQLRPVPDADSLQFRDVHAEDARTAWILSAGPGELSRIYHTEDGGESWALQWVNDEPDGFYDCLDFWDARRGMVYGDAVGGSLRVRVTSDGGRSWRLVPGDDLPAALPGEGGFAASGTCLRTGPGGRAWIAAGNAPSARVFGTSDYGATWWSAGVPVVAGEGAGLFSISMVDTLRGTAFGGDLSAPDRRTDNVARTVDGGRSWTLLPPLAMTGAAYGGVHVPGTGGDVLLAVGPGGADLSLDGGATWRSADGRAWWGIGSGGPGATWITGPDGRIARLRLR